MKCYFHVYLYVYEDGWGFRVPKRDVLFYNVDPDELNDKPTIVLADNLEQIEIEDMKFAFFNNKLYGSFKSDEVEKNDLLRVEVDIGEI